MPCIKNRVAILAVSSACLALLAAVPARGAAPRVVVEETREYEVSIKGKPAGRTTIHITETEDGMATAATDANVQTKYFLFTYRYEFHGTEIWRGDRLERVDSHAVDDGKQLSARASVDPRGSRIEIQNKPAQPGPLLAMTTNYWRLPSPAAATGDFSILDADTGIVQRVRLERVGPEQVAIGGRNLPCTHYRLAGTVKAELWFDARGRMVRQQTVEDGYPTELRLTQITDNLRNRDAGPR